MHLVRRAPFQRTACACRIPLEGLVDILRVPLPHSLLLRCSSDISRLPRGRLAPVAPTVFNNCLLDHPFHNPSSARIRSLREFRPKGHTTVSPVFHLREIVASFIRARQEKNTVSRTSCLTMCKRPSFNRSVVPGFSGHRDVSVLDGEQRRR